jgi:hypothetical protein
MNVMTATKMKNFFSESRTSKLVAAGVALMIIVAGALFIAVRASGFFASLDPTSGQLQGNAKLVSDNTALNGKAIQFTAPIDNPPPPPPTGGKLNLPRVAWEGGPSHYAQYPSMKNTSFTDPNFFPTAVWYESVLSQGDVDKDKQAGLNLYVELVDAPQTADLLRKNGMYAFSGGLPNGGSETVASLLTDEADMFYGAGWDKWSGREGWNTCIPIQDQGGKCGYTLMQQFVDKAPKNGNPLYANYGKGVMLWESDAEASVFVNQFQQIVSNDLYFYTDTNICGGESQTWLGIPTNQCRRAANYGFTMDKMRRLDAMDGKLQPIYAFVEDGHPAGESTSPTITGDQMAGAVFNSLIHEARGVIYFNHSFGGPCQSQHVLRDCGLTTIRPKVIETNSRIKQLAPILNSQSYQYSFNPNLETMLKEYNGNYYIFAMQKRSAQTSGTFNFTLPSGMTASKVEAMFENRTVPVSGNSFSDNFAAEYSYHVYKVTP